MKKFFILSIIFLMAFAGCGGEDYPAADQQTARYADSVMSSVADAFDTATTTRSGKRAVETISYTSGDGTITLNGSGTETETSLEATVTVTLNNLPVTGYDDSISGSMTLYVSGSSDTQVLIFKFDASLNTASGHTFGMDIDFYYDFGNETGTYSGTLSWDGATYTYQYSE